MLLGKKGGKNEKIRRLKTTIMPIQHCIKETFSKVKRQPSYWEKIIANEATD